MTYLYGIIGYLMVGAAFHEMYSHRIKQRFLTGRITLGKAFTMISDKRRNNVLLWPVISIVRLIVKK